MEGVAGGPAAALFSNFVSALACVGCLIGEKLGLGGLVSGELGEGGVV